MAPVLQGLKDMTGYHWVLLGGGPNPQHDGAIGTVQYVVIPCCVSLAELPFSLNAGLNQSNVPMYWRQWDEKRFDEGVITFFKDYLETCFSAYAIVLKLTYLLTTCFLYSSRGLRCRCNANGAGWHILHNTPQRHITEGRNELN